MTYLGAPPFSGAIPSFSRSSFVSSTEIASSPTFFRSPGALGGGAAIAFGSFGDMAIESERAAVKMIRSAVVLVRRQRRARFVGVALAFVALRAAASRARANLQQQQAAAAAIGQLAAAPPPAPAPVSIIAAAGAVAAGAGAGAKGGSSVTRRRPNTQKYSSRAMSAMLRVERSLSNSWGFSSLGELR